jgi:transposase-like protein
MVNLSEPRFHDDAAAREYLERLRWPDGPVCPHCGNAGKVYASKRPGRYRCGERECRKDFTVTVGTLFERSHVPLHKWVLAVHLLCASKKGISSHQLHRTLGVQYKTAWFITHRIREAMRDGFFAEPIGGAGKAVEVDETFWGNERRKPQGARGYQHKMKVLTLVERDGKARSFHLASVNAET